jgi:nucleoside-diphosphate-sugar epimerase
MDNVLVTGATGYVGCEVVKQLKKLEKKVTALGRTFPKEEISFIQADITDQEELKKALKGKSFDCILHLASLPGDTGNPLQMVKVNINGCQNILEFARESKTKRFILASSLSAYEWFPGTKFNPPDYLPVDEKHPCRPKDMYSTTKYMQELLALTYYYQYKVPVIILRLTAVVGPGGKGGGRSWRKFAESLAEGKRIQIPHFIPEELCHYIDIRDVARMFIAAAEHPKAIGEIFNCAGPEPIRGFEFAAIVKELLSDIKVEYGFPWSMAQGKEMALDMTKAEKLINFKPKYTMVETIKSIKEWVDSGGLEKEPEKKESFEDGVAEN